MDGRVCLAAGKRARENSHPSVNAHPLKHTPAALARASAQYHAASSRDEYIGLAPVLDEATRTVIGLHLPAVCLSCDDPSRPES